MIPLPLGRIAQWAGGRLRGNDVLVDAVDSDSRTLDAGDGRAVLFVALKGEWFDGHDHAAAAAEAGARALLVSREVDVALPQVIVADTQRGLASFAAALQGTRTGKVIAITGSNGKTSVKTLLLAILQQAATAEGHAAYANPGNRNNEIGLPLAVLDAPEDPRFAIYEMGAGKPGDIAYLTAIVRPDIALINNIAPAHLERMGSLLGIADTKAAIYDALPADGVAVINADDAFAPYFAERAHGRRLIRFGLEASADVSARDIAGGADGSRFVLVTPQGETAVALAMPGRHNVSNALAAAALALGAGVTLDLIASGLAAARPVAGRLVTHRLANGAVLIDDSYNANPGSLNAAIDLLADGRGEAWLVLGDMREIGNDAQVLHAEAGRRASAAGIARLYTLGPLSAAAAQAFGARARSFDSHQALADALRGDLVGATAVAAAVAPTRVLVKGSRGSAMDRIVAALLSGESVDHAA
ncbi:MAG: UDP-N-acetylmuramoyl-tripeptide--D-alanyl-D-alanine ligase [Gammaproteobacteria bacterium]|nr:UDP-N-acetylmuramoyl-tripeptide--D-alanyl-D-alanine ligase [Gammaproteobacteria bacterium]